MSLKSPPPLSPADMPSIAPEIAADKIDPPDELVKNLRRFLLEAAPILDKAQRVELYSLDPDDELEKSANDFHGWRVLGKTQLNDAKTRSRVTAAIDEGLINNDSIAMCFFPRHGIRATHNGKTVDLVICFECQQMHVRIADQAWAVLIFASPQPILDQVLRDADIPLAPKPGEA